MQTYSAVRLFALLCVLYVTQSAAAAQRIQDVNAVDDTLKNVNKRSTDEDKRGFRPDLGKRYDEDDDDALRESLKLLIDSQERNERSFRGDLGKRRSSFRGDLGKRPFRGDLGKRRDDGPLMSAEKRPRLSSFRGDLGKRRPFRGDLGKRGGASLDDMSTMWIDGYGDEVGMDRGEVGRDGDFSKRPYAFRGDLGKRRASFRGDLGK